MSNILLLEDEASTMQILRTVLTTEGYSIKPATTVEQAAGLVDSEDFALLIADISKNQGPGIGLIQKVRKDKPTAAVVVIADENQDITAIGAVDGVSRIQKPLRMDDLLTTVQRAVDYNDRALAEIQNLKLDVETSYLFDDVVAASPTMHSVCDMASRIAATDVTVLILGEKGAGKSLMARTIHNYSTRKAAAFAAVSCADNDEQAISKSLFGHGNDAGALESATGGTVYLDAVDSLPLQPQAALLDALQERRVSRPGSSVTADLNVRIVASSQVPLNSCVQSGKFNADLHKYLKAIVIAIPALRQRTEDIGPIIARTIRREKAAGQPSPTLDPQAAALLQKFSWPGNVKQLEEAIVHALTALDENAIVPASLPDYVRQ